MPRPTPTSAIPNAAPFATREVEKITPDRDDADPWRATNRVWTAITHLTERRRDARIYGVPIRDASYNMLRLV